MKKFIVSALCAVAFGACGGGSGGGGGGPVLTADAGSGGGGGGGGGGNGDGGAAPLACNPVTQAGCQAGEKCAQLTESASPILVRTACVPDGTVGQGNACTDGAPGAATGYDDCVGGFTCIGGVCTEICDSGPPDGCRAAGEAFGSGTYCTSYENLFANGIGVCVPGCNPVDDSVSAGTVKNADCLDGDGCYLNSSRGAAACAGVPQGNPNDPMMNGSTDKTQNKDCYGPAGGGCYLNGCASGFTALLNNKVTGADGSVCVRYCSPVNTTKGSNAKAGGNAGKCSLGKLTPIGGTNGANGAHQCRFIQSFYSNTDQVPVEVGMCVPIVPLSGGSWADCKLFDFETLKADYNAATSAAAQTTVFNKFCLVDPLMPMTSALTPKCDGYRRGCLSLAKQAEMVDVTGASFNFAAWAAARGIAPDDALNTQAVETLY